MSNPNNKLEQLCNYLLCQIPYLLQRFHSTDIMLRFSVFQFHLQLIKTTWHGKSTSAGCDVKAELRNKAFYTVVPLPTDFQCLLLLSARNAWGRQIRVYEPFFRASKYNVVFKGSVMRLVLSYLNLSEQKNVFTCEKKFNFQRNFLYTNIAAVTSCKKTNLYQKTSELTRLSDVIDFAMLLAQTFGGK